MLCTSVAIADLKFSDGELVLVAHAKEVSLNGEHGSSDASSSVAMTQVPLYQAEDVLRMREDSAACSMLPTLSWFRYNSFRGPMCRRETLRSRWSGSDGRRHDAGQEKCRPESAAHFRRRCGRGGQALAQGEGRARGHVAAGWYETDPYPVRTF